MTGVQTCALPICFPVTIDKTEKNVGTNIGTNAETQTNNENAQNAQNTLFANIIEHSVKYEPVPEDKKNQ